MNVIKLPLAIMLYGAWKIWGDACQPQPWVVSQHAAQQILDMICKGDDY
jgi:hypothetical protein